MRLVEGINKVNKRVGVAPAPLVQETCRRCGAGRDATGSSVCRSPTHGCFSSGKAGPTRSAAWGPLGGGLRSSLAEPGVLSHSALSNCTGRGGLERKGLSPNCPGGAGRGPWTLSRKMVSMGRPIRIQRGGVGCKTGAGFVQDHPTGLREKGAWPPASLAAWKGGAVP